MTAQYFASPALVMAQSALAAAVSVRLLQQSYSDESLPGCDGTESGCAAALSTRWAWWGPLPVAGLGTMLYVLSLVVAFGTFVLAPGGTLSGLAPEALQALSLIAGGAAIWFLFVQSVLIGDWCIYCTTVHLIGLSMGVAVAMTKPAAEVMSIAGLGVSVLILGQVALTPRSYKLHHPAPTAEGPAAGPSHFSPPPATAARTVAKGRSVLFLAGRVSIDPGRWPILGKPNATAVVACLFDHTCSSCRNVYRLLHDAVERFHPNLAMLVVPVPQHPNCNPTITAEPADGNVASCQFARLALALWRHDPVAFRCFDDWLTRQAGPPTIDSAVERAAQLGFTSIQDVIVGGDLTIEHAISEAADLYREAGAKKVPTLLLPRAIIAGEIPSASQLDRILAKELGLKPTGHPGRTDPSQ